MNGFSNLHTQIHLDLIGVANHLGCQTPSVADTPRYIDYAAIQRELAHHGLSTHRMSPLEPRHDLQERVSALAELMSRLADQVEASLNHHHLPVVLGGDHSTAIGTWRGVARALAAEQCSGPGLLWFDAHLDAHTPATTPSGNLHGMPLAVLLGEGPNALTDIPGPRLQADQVVLFGARSWENGEYERLCEAGVRIYTMHEITQRGLDTCLAEAIHQLRQHCTHWGVSLDMDVFDSHHTPFTTTPTQAGLEPRAFLRSVTRHLKGLPGLCAIECVEYLAAQDPHNEGLRLWLDFITALCGPDAHSLQHKEFTYGARNYAPLPAVFERGEGVWLYDVEGRKVLDMMSAYSAVSFGHCHPRLTKVLIDQAQRLTLTSRAVSNARLPVMLEKLCELTGMDRALPMNTGMEAVETAIKAARKWGHTVKGIAPDRAEIIACEGNFHGRSTLIVGLSSEPQYQAGFGPFPGGLKRVPFGDAAALEAAITPDTAAFLVEPIQGEGGIIVPPDGYLAECQAICRRHNVLLLVDEVQTGLGRTGALLACHHENVQPDGLILGKALGGGMYPVSAFLASKDVMNVFQPGDHGSTFGGNPLAAAIALEAMQLLIDERLPEQALIRGDQLRRGLEALKSPLIKEVRGKGLLIGVEINPELVNAHDLAIALLHAGVLTKDTHGTVLRLAPPLIIQAEEIKHALGILEKHVS